GRERGGVAGCSAGGGCRWLLRAAATASLPRSKAARTPRRVALRTWPPCASTAARRTASCTASAGCVPCEGCSQGGVEDSRSVKRNVSLLDDTSAIGPYPTQRV